MPLFNPMEFEELMPILKKAAPGIISAADDIIPAAMSSLNSNKQKQEQPVAKGQPLKKLMFKTSSYFADASGDVYDTNQITIQKALAHLLGNTTVGTAAGAIGGAGLGAAGAKLMGKPMLDGAKYGGIFGGSIGAAGGALTGSQNRLKPVGKIDYKEALKNMQQRRGEKTAGVMGASLGLLGGTAVSPFTGLAGGLAGGIAGEGLGTGAGALVGLIKSLAKGGGRNLNPQVLDRVGSKFKPVESLGQTVASHADAGGYAGRNIGMAGGAFGGAFYPMWRGIRAGSGIEDFGIEQYKKNKENE